MPQPGPTGVEGAGGSKRPGCGAGRRWQGLVQTNFACNSPTTRIDTRSKTAEYQRLDFNT